MLKQTKDVYSDETMTELRYKHIHQRRENIISLRPWRNDNSRNRNRYVFAALSDESDDADPEFTTSNRRKRKRSESSPQRTQRIIKRRKRNLARSQMQSSQSSTSSSSQHIQSVNSSQRDLAFPSSQRSTLAVIDARPSALLAPNGDTETEADFEQIRKHYDGHIDDKCIQTALDALKDIYKASTEYQTTNPEAVAAFRCTYKSMLAK